MVEMSGTFLQRLVLPQNPMMRSLTVPQEGPNVPCEGRWIPRPFAPVEPILSLGSMWPPLAPVPSILDIGRPVFVTAGRIAIALAFELMGVRPGQKVLMPAYHCASMIEALSWVRAEPVFYRIREDLSADLGDAGAKIDGDTVAMVAVNFFGFAPNPGEVRDFCADRGIRYLEDCAHALFGEHQGQPLGSFGDYAIGSLVKFLPMREGGCLASRHDPDLEARIALQGQGFAVNLREALDSLEIAVGYGRLPALLPALALAKLAKTGLGRLRRASGDGAAPGRAVSPAQIKSGAQGGFDGAWMRVRQSAFSRLLCRLSSRRRVVERRRAHYRDYLAAFADVGGARPLLRDLPDGVVPYMFPLWVDRLGPVFEGLEDRAVPILRFGQFLWPGVDAATCPTSFAFSKHLVQLPCHQELTAAELQRIIGTVGDVLARNRPAGAVRQTVAEAAG